MVTPQGLEPMITGVRGRLPKPLEDGAIKVRCLTHILRDISDNPPNFLWRYGYLSARLHVGVTPELTLLCLSNN